MDIRETLKYIHSVKWQRMKPGLERTRTLLRALGNPEKSLKFVHIAGTNGKGSTSACIAAVLQKAGYRTGMYTSPYIQCFNERMQVNGVNITDDELTEIIGEIRPFADAMEDSPTEFELITALAMKHFLYCGCDIVVLEVGMGGELDSTNVIDTPELAVITAIGYDHVRELGPTLADIAGAKAGIIKSGGDVVMYRDYADDGAVADSGGTDRGAVGDGRGSDDDAGTVATAGDGAVVEAVIQRVCSLRGARLRKADFSRITDREPSLDGQSFICEPYGRLSIPLAGAYQYKNAAVAITALETLREKGYRISDRDIAEGLAGVKWPGRFETLCREPVFILDGAHNSHGFKAVAESLRGLFGSRKIIFVTGVMADKDVDEMMRHIAPLAEAFIAVRPDYPRAMDAEALAGRLSRYGVPVFAFDTVERGVRDAVRRAGKDRIICALGSLYMSDDVRKAVLLTESC